eukprot:11182827-Lingulodinium_polyedra.AAC.1
MIPPPQPLPHGLGSGGWAVPDVGADAVTPCKHPGCVQHGHWCRQRVDIGADGTWTPAQAVFLPGEIHNAQRTTMNREQ